MNIYQGPKAVPRFPRTPKGLLPYAKVIVIKLADNPFFTYPHLADFEAAVTALDAAQVKADDRSPASGAERDAKALQVYRRIERLVPYVQEIADLAGSPAGATAVIVSAGLEVRRSSSYNKPELAAKYTGMSGQVLLVARAVPGAAAYYWEYSLDGESWTAVPETTASKTVITGFEPGVVCYFRFRVLTNKGKRDHSQVVGLLVH